MWLKCVLGKFVSYMESVENDLHGRSEVKGQGRVIEGRGTIWALSVSYRAWVC